MTGYRTIKGVTSYKPLNRCNMEELAAYQRQAEPSGGILFARHKNRDEKEQARNCILKLFTPTAWPGHLAVLTMPGLGWRFERLLLGQREPGWLTQLEYPGRTRIISIENDRALYYAATNEMPGRLTRNAVLSVRRPPVFAEHALKTRFVKRFYLGDVDDLMLTSSELVAPRYRFDAAWLDYTGPLTVRRLQVIAEFYRVMVRGVLIVTALRARWDRATSTAIEQAGGHSQWLQQALPGSVEHDLHYQDTVPMAQFAVRKRTPLWNWAAAS